LALALGSAEKETSWGPCAEKVVVVVKIGSEVDPIRDMKVSSVSAMSGIERGGRCEKGTTDGPCVMEAVVKIGSQVDPIRYTMIS
jgi:hypothetical protein